MQNIFDASDNLLHVLRNIYATFCVGEVPHGLWGNETERNVNINSCQIFRFISE
jgi:hypothetical protein